MKMEKEDIFKVISAITTIFVFKAYKIIKKPSERDQVVLYLKDKIKETTGSLVYIGKNREILFFL